MLFAAVVFSGDRFQVSIRILMIVSGVLALAGMSGVVDGASEKIADNSTRMNPLIRDVYGHQVWADAEHWRAIDRSPPPAAADKAIRDRLHHIHLVQRAFRWIVGDRQSTFTSTKPDDFATPADLKAYARDSHDEIF
jgi:hypothetical protein